MTYGATASNLLRERVECNYRFCRWGVRREKSLSSAKAKRASTKCKWVEWKKTIKPNSLIVKEQKGGIFDMGKGISFMCFLMCATIIWKERFDFVCDKQMSSQMGGRKTKKTLPWPNFSSTLNFWSFLSSDNFAILCRVSSIKAKICLKRLFMPDDFAPLSLFLFSYSLSRCFYFESKTKIFPHISRLMCMWFVYFRLPFTSRLLKAEKSEWNIKKKGSAVHVETRDERCSSIIIKSRARTKSNIITYWPEPRGMEISNSIRESFFSAYLLNSELLLHDALTITIFGSRISINFSGLCGGSVRGENRKLNESTFHCGHMVIRELIKSCSCCEGEQTRRGEELKIRQAEFPQRKHPTLSFRLDERVRESGKVGGGSRTGTEERRGKKMKTKCGRRKKFQLICSPPALGVKALNLSSCRPFIIIHTL